MKVKSESEVAQSCLTLSDSMDGSLPGSPVHGVFQARVLEWGAITFSEEFTYTCLKEMHTFVYAYKILKYYKNTKTLGSKIRQEKNSC